MSQVLNQDIARILKVIADYHAMEGVAFKPQAYTRAAQTVADLDKDLRDIYNAGGIKALKAIPGIGQSIAEHIEELLKTGKLKYYETLKKKVPVDVAGLTAIEGLGPKSIRELYEKLDIRTVADLRRAATAGKIRVLEGFGAKKEENILKGLEFLKKGGGRFTLAQVGSPARSIEERLKKVPGVQRVTVAGSFRRSKETVGDIDVLVEADKAKETAQAMKVFTEGANVARVLAHGPTKSSVKLGSGLQADLRVVPAKSFGAALNYFTGSKDHNVALRERAIKMGLKLNEYGLWKGTRQVAGRTEEELYHALGLEYIEPELRENAGEIHAALAHKLPKLIGYGDLQGDLHTHTDWTDGTASIEQMALAAAARGLKYIAITDHTKRLAMTGGLDEVRILKQMTEIDRVQKKVGSKIKILKGTECDILKDGTLDLPDRVLARLDVVGVSLHSFFNLPEKEQTARAMRAIRNPHADIFCHPTGRIINKREPCKLDMPTIIKAAKETGMVMEINSSPERLDLKDDHIRMCVEAEAKLAIDSDGHAPTHFSLLAYGIAQARRGWAEKKDVINAWPLEKMLGMLKK